MSEILPIHALKAQIIQHALDALEPAPATRSTLDPAKRCDPPEFKYGRWWPMECPDNDGVYQ